jgi:hypothetical protein
MRCQGCTCLLVDKADVIAIFNIKSSSEPSLDVAIAMDNVLMLAENLQFIKPRSDFALALVWAFTVTPTYLTKLQKYSKCSFRDKICKLN